MENVNNALRKEVDTAARDMGVLSQPSARIYQRIAANLDHVKDMLEGEKADEYGNPSTMCRNISQRWFGCDDAGTEVALMMAELKIERIKYDPSKEDSYLDAIAYLTMALSFMQDGGKND